MSVAADRVVRLVARTLPEPIRARYGEEWRADVAAAAAHGVSPASVAAGAAVFSITLDRDLPSVSGFPVPEQSRRHARWALAFAGLAALFGITRVAFGEFGVNAMLIAVVFVLAAVVKLWAAARLSSALGRTAAALGTAGMVVFAATTTIPTVSSLVIPGSRHLPSVAMALIVVAMALGIIVWVRGVRRWIVALLVVATAVVGASLTFVPLIGPVLLAAVVVFVGIAMQARAMDGPRSRRARAVVGVTSLGLLALTAFTAFDALVMTPLRIAGDDRPLDAVYSALPDAETGVGQVVAWAVVILVALLAYLALGLRFAPRWGTRRSALLGIALGAVLVLSSNLASFWLVQQLVDMFARVGFTYPEPRWGLYLQLFAIALLAVSAVGWIAPRAAREVLAAAN